MVATVCPECGKEFESSRTDNPPCYPCALQQITGGSAPEEGDFNSAAIQSGTLSSEDRDDLDEDFVSVEAGRFFRGAVPNDDENGLSAEDREGLYSYDESEDED